MLLTLQAGLSSEEAGAPKQQRPSPVLQAGCMFLLMTGRAERPPIGGGREKGRLGK